MGLKLLQPSLRPLGQFDLKDDDLATLEGGCYVELEDLLTGSATEGYAADVGNVGPTGPTVPATGDAFASLAFSLATKTTGNLGGLADDGETGYGTLYGTVIGGTAVQGTGLGTLSTTGVVTVGPSSAMASGKVTVWHAPGLYGVDSAALASADPIATDTAINDAVHSNSGFLTIDASSGNQVAISVGSVADSSLVSTSERAVTSGIFTSTDREYFAIYHLGV